jgi:hypothetical protein
MNNMSIFKTFPLFSQYSFPTSAPEKYITYPFKNSETKYARIFEAVQTLAKINNALELFMTKDNRKKETYMEANFE